MNDNTNDNDKQKIQKHGSILLQEKGSTTVTPAALTVTPILLFYSTPRWLRATVVSQFGLRLQ